MSCPRTKGKGKKKQVQEEGRGVKATRLVSDAAPGPGAALLALPR